MLKNLTLKKKLDIMAFVPIFVVAVVAVGFIVTSNSIIGQLVTTTDKECLTATQLILNADRDGYQALTALQLFVTASKAEKPKYVKDYKENIGQVKERVSKAESILNNDNSKWAKFVNKDTNNNVFKEFELQKNDFNRWENAANRVIEGKANLKQQESQFDTAREHLNVIGDLVNSGSESIIKGLEQSKNVSFSVLSGICLVMFSLIILFSSSTAKMISTRLATLVKYIKEVANKNLALDDLKIDANDEIDELSAAINTMNHNIKSIVQEVEQSVENLTTSSEQIYASSDQTAQGAQQTASSTQQLAQGSQEIATNVTDGASTISDMNKDILSVSQEAEVVANLSNQAEVNANKGKNHVDKAVVKIDSIKNVSEDISVTISELGNLSTEIGAIVDLIKSIAGQTNLLALNAAIEAARAGEHGKGFAVVADEVKILANQSSDATEKITAMIKEIQDKTQAAVKKVNNVTSEVEEGVTVVNDAGNVLEKIISDVQSANTKIQAITKEIERIVVSSDEVVKMVENISAITEETAASAEEISSITEEQTASLEEISASSQTLANIAENLHDKVSEFRV